ncbi:MAG: AbrB/MazE/SpoVT family DNA-binding domain-containing protein [Nanoarchaeota archaeon]
MIEVEAKVRKWGRSFGVVIPKEKIKEEGIKENETIKLLIAKRTNVLKETFGTFKLKRSTQEILDESDREDWDE